MFDGNEIGRFQLKSLSLKVIDYIMDEALTEQRKVCADAYEKVEGEDYITFTYYAILNAKSDGNEKLDETIETINQSSFKPGVEVCGNELLLTEG